MMDMKNPLGGDRFGGLCLSSSGEDGLRMG
jgi:hypothetical protein